MRLKNLEIQSLASQANILSRRWLIYSCSHIFLASLAQYPLIQVRPPMYCKIVHLGLLQSASIPPNLTFQDYQPKPKHSLLCFYMKNNVDLFLAMHLFHPQFCTSFHFQQNSGKIRYDSPFQSQPRSSISFPLNMRLWYFSDKLVTSKYVLKLAQVFFQCIRQSNAQAQKI